MKTTRESIDRFLKLPCIAMVGVSRNARDFSRMLWKEMRAQGLNLVPVNANATEIDAVPAAKSIAALASAPDGVLLMLPADQVMPSVKEAVARGVKSIWFYRATGSGAVDPIAVEYAHAAGVDVIAGECPFMFLPKAGFPHNIHRGLKSLFGTLPK